MKRFRPVAKAILIITVCSLGYFPARLAIATFQAPKPQLIFVLGGTPDREKKAAQLAQKYPNLEIWVSSGTSEAQKIFNQAGIAPSRIRFDRQATDTVTNFTTLLSALEQHNVHHVYLVTSDFHMGRSTAIATVIFGSHGIAFTPAPIRNPYYPKESPLRTWRDVGRAFVWIFTGRTGSSLRDE